MMRLAHYSVRTTDLEGTTRFYTEGLGLRPGTRPDFAFPGVWLYLGDDESDFGVVHVIGLDPDDPDALNRYLGERSEHALHGSGALDHIAFFADNWPEIKARFTKLGLDYQMRTVPGLGLLQVFVKDPSGVTIELNFEAVENEIREVGFLDVAASGA